jgi:mono/diheme cytochrome c family protein
MGRAESLPRNKLALKIGASAYNQNCARCHGLEAVTGGIAPICVCWIAIASM